jgi:archaellum biogenesis ATPase FlaH
VNGKIICINGPSFSGKTFLSNRIMNHIFNNTSLTVSNVSFEMVWKQGMNYNDMVRYYYDLISSKLELFNIVMCESTITRLSPAFHIICMPSLEQHKKNYDEYKKNFGVYDAIRRSYHDDTVKLRNDFNKRYKHNGVGIIDMTDESISECLQEVLNYVSN